LFCNAQTEHRESKYKERKTWEFEEFWMRDLHEVDWGFVELTDNTFTAVSSSTVFTFSYAKDASQKGKSVQTYKCDNILGGYFVATYKNNYPVSFVVYEKEFNGKTTEIYKFIIKQKK